MISTSLIRQARLSVRITGIASSTTVRGYISRAHPPKSIPSYPIGEAVSSILELTADRKTKRQQKWEKNAEKRTIKGIKVSPNGMLIWYLSLRSFYYAMERCRRHIICIYIYRNICTHSYTHSYTYPPFTHHCSNPLLHSKKRMRAPTEIKTKPSNSPSISTLTHANQVKPSAVPYPSRTEQANAQTLSSSHPMMEVIPSKPRKMLELPTLVDSRSSNRSKMVIFPSLLIEHWRRLI